MKVNDIVVFTGDLGRECDPTGDISNALQGEEGCIIDVFSKGDFPYEVDWDDEELKQKMSDKGFHLFRDDELTLKSEMNEVWTV